MDQPSPVQRAMQFNQLYPFRHAASGNILLNRHDIYIRGAAEHYGEFSEAEVDVFRDILTPDDLVVEVGANMGAHTLALASLASQVYCFEPQRFMFQTLCANLALNSVDNVIPKQAAVGRESGTVKIPCLNPRVEQNFGCLSLREPHAGGDFVPCTTLDSLVFPRLDLLKLDCEGSELAVLEGAQQTLLHHRPWIYLEFAENRAATMEFLTRHGYFFARHCPPINREPNFAGAPIGKHLNGAVDDSAVTSDMLLAMPAGREPRSAMQRSFGQRHGFFVAKDEDVLGRDGLVIEWVSMYE